MKTQKILIGGLVAGISMFFLGWLIYGMLLSGFMSENCSNTNMRPMDQMIWWALILSNLISGLLLAIVLQWSGSLTFGAGAKTGAILGLLIVLSFDLSMYSMSTMYNSFSVVIVDSICGAIMSSISGAIAAMVMSKVGNTTTS